AALRWLFDTMDVTRGARLASALWWFWTIRGYLSEGLAWYERAMRLCTRRDALRARVLLGAGLILYSQSNFSRARSLLEESASIWREGTSARDRHGLAFALMLLGHVLTWQGDFERARATQAESRALFQSLGDRWGEANSNYFMGRSYGAQRDQRMLPYFDAALEGFRAIADKGGMAIALNARGELARVNHDLARAAGFYQECL